MPFEFAIRNWYSWIRTIAFGTEISLGSVAASVNAFADSSRPATSVRAVVASQVPPTSPFSASVGNPEKSGSSGTPFRAETAERATVVRSSDAASVVDEKATRFPCATRSPMPVSLRLSATFGTSSSMYTEREWNVRAHASAASAPSARARRTASGARSSPSNSAASHHDLAAHVRASGRDRHVVFLAFPTRAAVEMDLARHPVHTLQDRERAAGERHPAHAPRDLALLNPEVGLRDGLERSTDGVLHAADPTLREDAGLRVREDLLRSIFAGPEVRVRHAHPDPAAEVLGPAVAGRAGPQRGGRLQAVEESAVDAPLDDRRLVGRRALRVERNRPVGARIGVVVVHRHKGRAHLLPDLVREERATLHDLVALRSMTHDLMREDAGDAGVRDHGQEACRRLFCREHLDGLARDPSPELAEVQRLHEFPAGGPISELVRRLPALPLAGDRLAGDADPDLPPADVSAPGVREFEPPIGLVVRGVRIRDSVPPLGAARLHRGGDFLLGRHVPWFDLNPRLLGLAGGRHLPKPRFGHPRGGPVASDGDGRSGRLRDGSGVPRRPGRVAPSTVHERAEAPSSPTNFIHTLDLFVRNADDEPATILDSHVTELGARLAEGADRGGRQLGHDIPR